MKAKRIASLLLTLVMAASTVTAFPVFASAAYEPNGPAFPDASLNSGQMQRASPTSIIIENVGDVTYNGTDFTPHPLITTKSGLVLKENVDYVLSYRDNRNAGAATIQVTGIGTYADIAQTAQFSIKPAPISVRVNDVMCAVNESPSFSYTITNGKLFGGDKLPEPQYSIYAKSSSTKGITVSFAGMKNYDIQVTDGTLTYTEVSGNITVGGIQDVTYNGSSHTPEPTIATADGYTLTKGTDYTLSYTNNLNAGRASITVTGIGRYAGVLNRTVTFEIKKAPLTVRVDDVKCSIRDNPKFSFSITGGTLFGSDSLGTPVFSTKSRTGHSYGPVFDIDVKFPDANSNYALTINKGTMTYTDVSYGSYTIDARSSSGGSISPSGRTLVYGGENQTFRFYPNSGYEIVAVYVDGRDVGRSSQYTFYDVTKNHEIYVDFARTSTTRYDIDASSSSGGSISPSGRTRVSRGDDRTFRFSPNSGYEVSAVYVDGKRLSYTNNSYTFYDVTADHTIYVEFERTSTVRYEINADSSSGGSISPSGRVWVNRDSSRTFTFSPNSGYQVAGVYVDGRKVSSSATRYTFNDVREDHRIYVEFERTALSSFKITAAASSGGSISPSGTATINRGNQKTYSFNPNAGYGVLAVYVDGSYVGDARSYTFKDIDADHEIYVRFAKNADIKNRYNIDVSWTSGGTVSPNGGGTISVDKGRNQTFTFTPNPGYRVSNVYVDGEYVSSDSSYTFKDVVQTHKLRVEFARGGITLVYPAYWANPFTDIRPGDWFYDSVKFMNANGLMQGTSGHTYSPRATTTRAMIVTILYRLEGTPAVSGGNPFYDVNPNAYYANAIAWAAKYGIVSGYGDGSFRPDGLITREQMAAILYRFSVYRGYDTSRQSNLRFGFTDYNRINSYAVIPLSWAHANGIVTGTTASTMSPDKTASRAEVTAILARFCQRFCM